jgi:hypothetical protein
MTAEAAGPVPGADMRDVIHLGGEVAVVVPVAEYRRLRALERLAPAGVVEEAEIEATLAAHREWVAAGRPGEVSQEEAAAELLGGR